MSGDQFQCVVSNASGFVASAPAVLTVLGLPPTISVQPVAQMVLVGSPLTLQVTTAGTGPFACQWQFNGLNLTNNIILTVAGGGSADEIPATQFPLSAPTGLAVDRAGNLFIADSLNNRIRKVGTNGIMATFAGSGSGLLLGNLGDGRPAIRASLNRPGGMAVDSLGNLFIVDSWSARIRKVDTNGIIWTVAGGGSSSPGDGKAATNAILMNAVGVAVDTAGNLFIAESGRNRIRKVDTNGIISTVAGNGASGYGGDSRLATDARLTSPSAVAVDAAGNLYISDSGNTRIREVDTNGVIFTVAGGGPSYLGDGYLATHAKLFNPGGIALDAAGNLYFADPADNRIRKVDTNGIISTVAGNGNPTYAGDGKSATKASLNRPANVTMDSVGNLFVADTGNNRIRRIDLNGIITTVAGSGAWSMRGALLADGTTATNAGLFRPQGVKVDAAGELFIADTWHQRVRKVDRQGVIRTVAGNGNYGFSGDGKAATNASLNRPSNVAWNAAGDLFIADTYNNRIRKVDSNGIITTVVGRGSPDYSGDGKAATNAGLAQPNDVAWDAAGNLLIADTGHHRVRKVDANGIITTVAGGGTQNPGDGGPATNASLAVPVALALDTAGNLYVADAQDNRVRRVDTNGLITTVAGNGMLGFAGDGDAATNASLASPVGVAVDSEGNLFIGDSSFSLVREVDRLGFISTVAGNGKSG
ncbi:MAG: SMP-30/gluconolactonase/LRE family protein, partial [Verrucomicrobia bacterium]|nr:SMP-30/gluconolactonase/LRE family protein [Verrucomicrobiota bacterium]